MDWSWCVLWKYRKMSIRIEQPSGSANLPHQPSGLSTSIDWDIRPNLHPRPTQRICIWALPGESKETSNSNMYQTKDSSVRYLPGVPEFRGRTNLNEPHTCIRTINFSDTFSINCRSATLSFGLAERTAHVRVWDVVQIFPPARIFNLGWDARITEPFMAGTTWLLIYYGGYPSTQTQEWKIHHL